ncbi:hypothetical protein ATKI12_6462 [Kitasatospora sp. Ki12]
MAVCMLGSARTSRRYRSVAVEMSGCRVVDRTLDGRCRCARSCAARD